MQKNKKQNEIEQSPVNKEFIYKFRIFKGNLICHRTEQKDYSSCWIIPILRSF